MISKPASLTRGRERLVQVHDGQLFNVDITNIPEELLTIQTVFPFWNTCIQYTPSRIPSILAEQEFPSGTVLHHPAQLPRPYDTGITCIRTTTATCPMGDAI